MASAQLTFYRTARGARDGPRDCCTGCSYAARKLVLRDVALRRPELFLLPDVGQGLAREQLGASLLSVVQRLRGGGHPRSRSK